MKPKKLLQEIKNLGWNVEVRKEAPGVYVGDASKGNCPTITAAADSDGSVIVELNRRVRWYMAGRYLRANETITFVTVGVPDAAEERKR